MSAIRSLALFATLIVLCGLMAICLWLRAPVNEFQALCIGVATGALPFTGKLLFQHALRNPDLLVRYLLTTCIAVLVTLVVYGGVTGELAGGFSERDRFAYKSGALIGCVIGVMWLVVSWVETTPKE